MEVAGYRVSLAARPGPAGTGWVATVGAVVPVDGAGARPVPLEEAVRWRLLARGYGDSREAALADLAAGLRAEARRAGGG